MAKIKNFWKVLPFGSFINWTTTKSEYSMSLKEAGVETVKALAHLAYAFIPTAIMVDYIQGISDTGSRSYLEQKRIYAERLIKQEEIKAQYAKLEQNLFGEDGLADTDYNGELSPREKLTAYENMDLDSIIVLPARKPTIQELERAEHLYKTQRAKENENFK